MAQHVMIVQKQYRLPILQGRKTIESRLTVTARPPFGCITPGERLLIKESGGPFFAVAEVAQVIMADALEPEQVDAWQRTYNHGICGDPDYWHQKRARANYAVLIFMRHVRPWQYVLDYPAKHMCAWYVLDDSVEPDPPIPDTAAPIRPPLRQSSLVVPLTEGSLRQGYLCVRPVIDALPADAIGGRTRNQAGVPVELVFPDGRVIATDIVGLRGCFRARCWGGWFRSLGATARDRVRLTLCGPRRYEVTLQRESDDRNFGS